MNRVEKESLVKQVSEILDNSGLVVVASQQGLTVEKSTMLRVMMRQGGACYKIVKNTLLDIAVQGTKWEGLSSYFKGPTAIAYSKDPISAAKVLVQFAEKNDGLSVVGGSLDGKTLGVKEVMALAKLPSLNEIRAQMIALVNAPAAKIARTVMEPSAQLARLCGAYANKS